MNAIMRRYGIGLNTIDRQAMRSRMADLTRTRGTAQVPQPPRNLVVQSASRGVTLTWNLPQGFTDDIQRWRIYRGDESTLYAEVNDRGVRQYFVELTAGSTPPVTTLFVTSVNALGKESRKISIQAQATVEASAPAIPSVPPDFNQGSAGGGDTSTNYSDPRYRNKANL